MPEAISRVREIEGYEDMVVQRALGGGPVSRSWLLTGDLGEVVLRQDGPMARCLGLNRSREFQLLRQAYLAGLGPEPLHLDLDGQWLLTRYVPGRAWTNNALNDPRARETLALLLRRVHALPADVSCFEPGKVAGRYAQSAPSELAGPLVSTVSSLGAELYLPEKPRCLCHHDPHPANLVGRQSPVLIDWEYAGSGLGLFDIAAVIRYTKMNKTQANHLLEVWADGADISLREELSGFCLLYDALSRLWTLAIAHRMVVG